MSEEVEYQTERLDHLGIVAGVCREAGIAVWLDAQVGAPDRRVSVGTAVVAMILNGLGFSNRQLYLVPQFFANKPVEHLLGKGITADMLNDDCLGRTLDWIYEHDPTTLFAGLALQARSRFGIKAEHLHVDTTSLSVSGEYAIREKKTKEGQEEGEIPIAITCGYSRDHRADLQQWMLALATTHDGDVPVFMRPLDGNSSDKKSISDAVIAVMTQLRATLTTEGDERIAVFDSGGYSESNMTRYNEMKIKWISRVPETSTEAKKVIRYKTGEWLPLSDGSGSFTTRIMELPQGKERWVIMHTDAGEEAAKEQMEKKVKKSQDLWEKRLWHLSKQEFSCEDDALKAGKQALKGLPLYLTSSFTFQEERRYEQKGRPKKDTAPDMLAWRLIPSLSVDQTEVENQSRQQACFIIATTIIEEKVLGSGSFTSYP